MNHDLLTRSTVHILDVKNDNLDRLIKTMGKPMIIDFWAPWCGPCRQMNPIIYDLAEDLGGKVKVLKVNIEENEKTAEKYEINSIPTLLILDKEGNPIGEPIIGVSNTLQQDILGRLEKYI